MLMICREEINSVKLTLEGEFEMKDTEAASKILGMHIARSKEVGSLIICHKSHIQKVLRKFNMDQSKLVTTPLADSPKTDEERKYME